MSSPILGAPPTLNLKAPYWKQQEKKKKNPSRNTFFAVLRNFLLPCQGLAKLERPANSWSHATSQEKALHLGKRTPALVAAALHRELQHSQGSVFLEALRAGASAKTPAVGEDFIWIPARGQWHPAATSGMCLNPESALSHHRQGRKFHSQLLNTSHIPCFTTDIPHKHKRLLLVPNGIPEDLKILSC